MSNGKRMRRQRELMHRQNPRCFWCGRITVLWKAPKNQNGNGRGTPPRNAATIDHLRSRYDPTRQEKCRNQEVRRVLACWECNALRNAEEQRQLMRERPEELWRRAGAYPRPVDSAIRSAYDHAPPKGEPNDTATRPVYSGQAQTG